MFMHGLWAWNWADSHRPLLSIRGGNITVGADDINRDVNPIHAHKPAMQGGRASLLVPPPRVLGPERMFFLVAPEILATVNARGK